MFSHIHSMTVPVADQDAALDFYVNILGWEKAMDNLMADGQRWLTVVPPGATTQLALAPLSWYSDDKPLNRETGISIVATDIHALHETLKARGVTFKQPVTVMPWGTEATWFYDHDGNEFFLVAA